MKCIIVDDEYPSIRELNYFITNFSSIKILGEFVDSVEAFKFIQGNAVDVIFLDISMPKLDGLSFAEAANTLKKRPALVFITAFSEHAVEAFEVVAFDYILKPYSEGRIVNTLQRLENFHSARSSSKITLKKDERFFVVNIADIYYCEANKHQVNVFTKHENYTITASISDFYKKLPSEQFFRCHRSFIINIDKITEIVPWFNNTYILKLKDIGREIPVSRQNTLLLRQLMGI